MEPLPMVRRSRKLMVVLLLVGCVFAAGGQHDYIVLCVPNEGHAALEFVSGATREKGAACPHGVTIRCDATVDACDDHHSGCVDIPLSVVSMAVPVKQHRGPQLQPQPVRGLVLVDTALPRSAAVSPTTLPPRPTTRSGPLLALRTVVLLT
jgi:hypothetical protein